MSRWNRPLPCPSDYRHSDIYDPRSPDYIEDDHEREEEARRHRRAPRRSGYGGTRLGYGVAR